MTENKGPVITHMVVGRTISMDKFSNEKQEFTIEIPTDNGKTNAENVKDAYALADKAFIAIYPTSGIVNEYYANYIVKKKLQYKQENSIKQDGPVTNQ